jgi:hypothetical protein
MNLDTSTSEGKRNAILAGVAGVALLAAVYLIFIRQPAPELLDTASQQKAEQLQNELKKSTTITEPTEAEAGEFKRQTKN